MYVTPTSELATAVRENLRKAVTNTDDCWEFVKIPPSSSYKIHDKNNILMYACKRHDTYKLNNLNGPAFRHLIGSKEMLFIDNEAYSEFDYNRHYAVKFIKNLKLYTPDQPIVGDGRYNLKGGYFDLRHGYNGGALLTVYNSARELHNDNGPAVLDFTYDNTIKYYKNGLLHRPIHEGPAVYSSGVREGDIETIEEYYTNGKKLTPEELNTLRKYSPEDIKTIDELDLPDF